MSRSVPNRYRCSAAGGERGFTLLEIVVVAVLMALIATLVSQRFGTVYLTRQRSEVRKFANAWETLFNEAIIRGEGYRLIIDLDDNSYYVRREVALRGLAVTNVDYLKNLRTKSERERRKRREEELSSVSTELEREDQRQGESLDSLYYEYLYADPNGPVRLTRPLEFPALAEAKPLIGGLAFTRVKTAAGEMTEGEVAISFSPRGASSFAVVYLKGERGDFTVFMNPSSGQMEIRYGVIDYDWKIDKSRTSGL
jgi:prepilin-type N-terminal cleavage/methylation domain-containing protein